jgi:hypothetical protein
MKKGLLLLLMACHTAIWCQSTALYDDNRVAKIYLQIPADSLQFIIDNLVNTRYFDASFVFDDGQTRDTVLHAGIRLRGNTSLHAQKKSFKVSFNAFEAGREYQGVRKLNLLGSHNDPTMIRQKLFYDVWADAGMPPRRGSFVDLYINGLYRGLYLNLEEIDKQWLTRVFENNDGNLYKCTYPADLVYHGDDQAIYKAIMNNPVSRAYDLTTNESADDYIRLVALIKTLNQPLDNNFADNISAILHVESALKSLALDVVTGNWDDYFVNKNNYYLYDNPVTGKFEFITFDTDNTFGIDWTGGTDWAKRHCLEWFTTFEPRPLASKLLAVPAFFNQYVHYLDSFTRHIVRPDLVFPQIDQYKALILPSATLDVYRTLDWGYGINEFNGGFVAAIDGHSPYGVKPFLSLRYDSTLAQIGHLVTSGVSAQPDAFRTGVVFPNPVTDWLQVQLPEFEVGQNTLYGTLHDATGRPVLAWQWQAGTSENWQVHVAGVPPGVYRMQLQAGQERGNWVVIKR